MRILWALLGDIPELVETGEGLEERTGNFSLKLGGVDGQ
jgi:hypothetical protein